MASRASVSVVSGVELCGLEDDGVAGGEGGQHLPHRHLQRVVPRRDRSDDADGLAPDAGGVVAGVLAGGLALEVAGRAGEEVDVVDAAGHVELAGQPRGLPVWLTSSATSSSACSAVSAASLASTADRSAGVAPAQPGSAVRAAATAASTSAGVANASSVDDVAGRRVDDLMTGAAGGHRRAVDPAAGHTGRYGHSHGPTLADDRPRRLRIPAVAASLGA